jgi:ferritin-like metal-binding protein YciE
VWDRDGDDNLKDGLGAFCAGAVPVGREALDMLVAATSEQLSAAFEKHHDETEGQIERFEQIFELLGKPARGKKRDAIEGA